MKIQFLYLYKIKTLVNQSFFSNGAADGDRTHEMPEPQSGVLTASPQPPYLS